MNRISRKYFLDNISVIMQDDTLLSGSIAENISFFGENTNAGRIRACAKISCIDEEIERMPMAYESLIGEMGSALSGGQKQRVLIARALYRDPKILFMDEASSHLDKNLERRINDNLSNLRITRVVVAHRSDTLRIADRILKLENGCFTDFVV